MKRISDWLDQRTGWRGLLKEALFERVPGGARWRYVWGSTLTFTFLIQVVTGIFLWMAYSPSAQTAWESVYYIQYELSGGWVLRGIHHFTAQAMNILLVLHLMQVLIDGAYKAPREVNFWFGLGLLMLVLGLSLTGYLLPWDQKGYWATKVATNLIVIVPLIGPELQQLIIGGSDYGHQTLTRFFALHAGVLPGLVVLLIVAHVYLFRRHGLKAKEPLRKPDAPFWPDQLLRDAVACLAVLAAVLVLVFWRHGAHLGAPADPSEQYSAARPEWYFLFLFELLKYFPGEMEIIGAIVIPTVAVLVLALMPILGRWPKGHRFNLAFAFLLMGGAGVLTLLALAADRGNPDYRKAVAAAERDAQRVVELARSPSGIPLTGAATLLREDPFTRGPRLFAQHCASCHRYDGHDGLGGQLADAPSASDLKGFASREWLSGLLDPERIGSLHYFGGTAFKDTKMVRFVRRELREADPEVTARFAQVAIALSAEAGLPTQREVDARDVDIIKQGREAIDSSAGCADCHEFHFEDENASGPQLTGYGSREWLTAFVVDPSQARFYGDRNDRMPAFGRDGLMTPREIEILVDWLREDWYRGEASVGTAQVAPKNTP